MLPALAGYKIPVGRRELADKIRIRRTEQLKNAYMAKQRLKYANAYMPWSATEDEQLRLLFFEGKTQEELVAHFSRNKGAIHSRLRKLGLL